MYRRKRYVFLAIKKRPSVRYFIVRCPQIRYLENFIIFCDGIFTSAHSQKKILAINQAEYFKVFLTGEFFCIYFLQIKINVLHFIIRTSSCFRSFTAINSSFLRLDLIVSEVHFRANLSPHAM
jgi:hypothetical protein